MIREDIKKREERLPQRYNPFESPIEGTVIARIKTLAKLHVEIIFISHVNQSLWNTIKIIYIFRLNRSLLNIIEIISLFHPNRYLLNIIEIIFIFPLI